MRLIDGSGSADFLAALVIWVLGTLGLVVLTLATLIGTRGGFTPEARRRARWWLIALLAIILALAWLSAVPVPDNAIHFSGTEPSR